jgi:FKBP-type peptidyl-prolyl cis-trans isomerase
LIPLAAIWILAAGCSESVTSPSGQAPFSQTDVRVGTGTDAAAGKVLTVHYTGWLYNGSQPTLKGLQFETSAGGTPFSFTLGAGQVISGWDQGLVGMKVGGIRRLIIPPSLAYGSFRNGVIPANATLVFDVELTGVQ